jgi:hypothetical protein
MKRGSAIDQLERFQEFKGGLPVAVSEGASHALANKLFEG